MKLRKVGGSVSAAIPPSVLEALSLGVGSELRVEVDNGQVVLTPTSPSGRIGIAARLAQCDFSKPRGKAEQAELDAWQIIKPVGREVL
ncbi:MAG: AbrB/MazE/SpoVT family DNA-binding domain-containing protein [Hyphomicrobiaceae bacterium]